MIVWNVDPILISLGAVQIRYYGLCFLITILGGFWLWRWQLIRAGRTADAARRFLLLGLLGLKINFLWLFYLGVWCDLLLFQIGIFLLGGKYFRRPMTTAFVAAILTGGIVWSCQIWWNLHQIYFMPVLLYAIHQGLETRKWPWFAGFLVFFFLGGNTQITYNIIFTAFTVVIYLLTILPRHRR